MKRETVKMVEDIFHYLLQLKGESRLAQLVVNTEKYGKIKISVYSVGKPVNVLRADLKQI